MLKTLTFPVSLIILSGALATSLALQNSARESTLARPLDDLSRQIGNWSGQNDSGPDAEISNQLGATSLLSRAYNHSGRTVGLFIAFYANQRAGRNMHTPKACLLGNGWTIWEKGHMDVPALSTSLRVNKFIVESSGRRLLIAYWYQSRRRIVADEMLDKLYLIQDALARRDVGESLVRLVTVQEAGAEEAIKSFAASLIPEVQRCLGHSAAP